MIKEEFLATVKLINAEEILAIVAPLNDDKLLVTNPITIEQTTTKVGYLVFKVLPWLKTTTNDTVIIEKRNIMTVVECFDVEMMKLYNNYLKGKTFYTNGNERKLTKDDGYICNVQQMKQKLEELYHNYNTDKTNQES